MILIAKRGSRYIVTLVCLIVDLSSCKVRVKQSHEQSRKVMQSQAESCSHLESGRVMQNHVESHEVTRSHADIQSHTKSF
jgi:hypothetical protein